MRLILVLFGIHKRSLVELLIRREILRPKDCEHMTKNNRVLVGLLGTNLL